MPEREVIPFVEKTPVKPSRVDIADDGEPVFLYTYKDYVQAEADYFKRLNPDSESEVPDSGQNKKSKVKLGLPTREKQAQAVGTDVQDTESTETGSEKNKSIKSRIGKIAMSYGVPTVVVASVLYGGTLAILGDRDGDKLRAAVATDVTLENISDGYQHVGKVAKAVIGFVS